MAVSRQPGCWPDGLILAPICPGLPEISHGLQATSLPMLFPEKALARTQYRLFLIKAMWNCNHTECWALASERSTWANKKRLDH